METGIHNTSEIGRLRKVLLHRPGQELENLMPEYLERLLFDDIPYLKEAQAEHDAFAQCLRDAGVEVVYLIDLVVNSLTSPEVRQELVTQFLKEADLPDEAVGKAVAEYLSELDDRAMVSAMMAGIRRSDLRKQGGRLSDHLSGLEEGYPFAVDPMPNLYFTRDPFATIGTGVSIHKMHTVTRNRETLFGRFIFEHNPWYQNAPRWYDRSASSSLEGGDILVLSPQVLAVGISQRTEGDSIDQLAQTVLSQSKTFQKVLAFNIPKSRSFMHLDTVLTQIDTDKFLIHPSILDELEMFELTPGKLPASWESYKDPDTGLVPLGDMAISLERAKQQAAEFGHSARREVGYLTIHSILHLLGYDHVDEGPMKKQMRAAEEAILAEIELPR